MKNSYFEKVLTCKPLLDDFIIDAHMHSEKVSRFFSRYNNGEDLIEQMDAIGINCGVVSNLWTTTNNVETRESIASFCNKFTNRLFVYAAPNPNFGFADFKKELMQYAKINITKGIKLHPDLHKKDFLCEEYRFAYELAQQNKWPVLLHTWGINDIEAMEAVAKEYNKTVFLLGHSGGEEKAVIMASKISAELDNVYLDTACSYVWHSAIEYMVKVAGANKILFGSDAYWNSIEASIGRILFAEIEDFEKKLILGENAKLLFNI